MPFDGNMEQLEAAADWESLVEWNGAHAPREPRTTSQCWVHPLRNGLFRVEWASASGTRGTDGPFDTLDVAEGWCRRYEADLGWKWIH